MSDFINSIEVLGDETVLKSLISRNITEYKDDILLTVGQNAFSYCYYMTNVDLPNVETIGLSAFSNCAALVSINIQKLKSVPTTGFNNTRIERISIPNATSINMNGFNDCINLKVVDLYNINTISTGSFKNTALETIIIRRDDAIPTLKSVNAFEGTPFINGDGYVYVPSSMVESYKTASNWSAFAAQIRAIEDYPDICG